MTASERVVGMQPVGTGGTVWYSAAVHPAGRQLRRLRMDKGSTG